MGGGGIIGMKRIALLLALALAGCARAPAAEVAHGRRLATVMGCTSCHGEKLDGHLFEENARFAVAWSSNLSRILPRWSDAQVEAALRTGRRPDGSALWFMPTFAHARLSRADMADLIAWLRTVPPSGNDHPRIVTGPEWRQALAAGFDDSAAQAARLKGRVPADAGPSTARGRYLAQIACAECHGPVLTGVPDPRPGDAPDLSAAAAYSRSDFVRLLRTGLPPGGRDLGWMTKEARHRLHALDDAEIAAIHDYLIARARR